jgi:hypothetical protein
MEDTEVTGFEQTGDTSAGSPPAAETGAPQQQPTAPAAIEQGAAPDPQQQGQMVPSYRLREVTERYRQLEQAALAMQQRLQAVEAQSRATGQPVDQETRAIRDQFRKIFPNLAALDEFDPDQLRGLLQQAPAQQQQWEQYWHNVGTNALRSLQAKVSEVYGEKIDPVTRSIFENAFISWVERDPEAQQRYLSQDPSLVDDYWKKATAAVLDPIRKNAAAQVAQRAERIGRLPSVPRSTTAIGQPKPPKPKTEDDLHDAAWNAALQQR